jgi:hypothetical protein
VAGIIAIVLMMVWVGRVYAENDRPQPKLGALA